ncbi:DNA-binding SARP family transcriptional activator [Kibdelosporangium banguiense]|uniref:DNA-binding SARP family transcriptional activator n=1 Tax=Kibdelosporangium banguiense TaxID=1365924 RepID=A0ABS4TRU4_9PSEU|nr:AfsR/SARP family transcriptional regulator [Kibdelosporangium banguiense]MBP2327139.1 DNA-binding SARP family transcriptional activator [Kibdelosporangium banguiense]
MNYEILGQIQVSGAPGVCAPRARKVETLLAILLTKANQVVTTEQLVVEIWGDKPPTRASDTLYVHVSQLRKLLRGSTKCESQLITSPRGYSLIVAPDELDADRFSRLYQQGRDLHRDRSYGQAAEVLRQAIALWRGPAFGGLIDTPLIQTHAMLLEDSRLECMELLMETELLIGRHREIVGTLTALTKQHLLRETFCEYLMTALLRCNRRAEAVEVFAAARRRMIQQLGIEPGRSMQDLHQRILLGERSEVAV